MIRQSLKWTGVAIVLLLAIILVTPYWLLHTAPGSRWLWRQVAAFVPGELRASAVDGSLSEGLRLGAVSFTNQSIRITVRAVELALDPDFFPLALKVRRLHLDDVVVQTFDQRPREESPAPFRLESLVLPVPIHFQEVRIGRLRVANGEGERLIAVDDAELAALWHEQISLSGIKVVSSVGRIGGTAALGLDAPYASGLSIVGVYPLQVGAETRIPVHFTAHASGSLEELEVDVTTRDPHVRATGTLSSLLSEPGWDLRVQSPEFRWPLTGQPRQVSLRQVELRSEGGLADYSVAGGGLVSVAAAGEARFSLDVRGNTKKLEVDRLALQGRMLDAVARGQLRWSDRFAIAFNADVGRFDPADLTRRWPAGKPVSGTVEAAWSADKLQLESVRLRVAGTGQAIDATGLVALDRGVVNLDLDWQNLQWPIDAGNADYRSEFGSIKVAGKPDAWTLDGRIAFAAAELPQGVFQLAGSGGREELAVTLRDSRVLGGDVAGRVTWRWKDGGPWSARLAADNIDVGALLPTWPGRISTGFTATGRQKPLEFDVEIDRLEGVIRGRQVEGAGGIHYANGNLRVRQLEISSGNSRLQANGGLWHDDGLDFLLDVESLSDFHPGAGGALEADGNVSLAGDFPVLRMNLQGRDLAWRDYRLEELTVDSRGMRSDTGVELDAEGHGLSLGAPEIEALSVQLAVSEKRQRVEVTASMDEKRADLALDGRLEDWRRPLASTWSGRLETLTFEAPEDIELALEAPAELRVATDALALRHACLTGPDESRLCLDANWVQGSNFEASAELVALPVDLLRLLVDTDLEFTQTLDGTLSAGSAAGRPLSAHALVDISPGEIRNQLDPRMIMHTRPGVFSLDLDSGRLLSGKLTLPFGSSAQIDARFGVDDVAAGSASSVNGELTVKLHDIGVVSTIVPSINAASGQLDVDLSLVGSLASPSLSGTASLRNGTLSYAPLGLKLTEIQLQSRIHEDDRFDLNSTFTAGEGHGEIVSTGNSINGIADGVSLSLNGTNLTVIDLPDINVVADMGLALGLRRDELEINGDILIPRARLSPSNITTTRVNESEDVIIVASENAAEETPDEPKSPFAMTGQVDLTLGDDVVIDLDATEASLSGSTSFTWNGPYMPTANGEYNAAGKYEAYGQLLEITDGSIRFPGVPADNPVLRIRAEREIFGNPRIRNAGVLISGTAKNPQIEVYSNPPTNNERALTLLVTGSDFDYEQGVGAVDVGTYIAPDLYISYGIGLFDRENVISLRYDLNKGFGIKATSGKRAEGVDLSYTVER